jgi:hypothetical protein
LAKDRHAPNTEKDDQTADKTKGSGVAISFHWFLRKDGTALKDSTRWIWADPFPEDPTLNGKPDNGFLQSSGLGTVRRCTYCSNNPHWRRVTDPVMFLREIRANCDFSAVLYTKSEILDSEFWKRPAAEVLEWLRERER